MSILLDIKETVLYLLPPILFVSFLALAGRGKSSFSAAFAELIGQLIIPGAVIFGTPFGVLHLYELAFGKAPNKAAALIILVIGLIPGYIGLSAIEKTSSKNS